MADRIPTLGDLCSAIAEGQIAATIDGAMYQMSVFELRRYLNKFRSLPTISTALDQSSSPLLILNPIVGLRPPRFP